MWGQDEDWERSESLFASHHPQAALCGYPKLPTPCPSLPHHTSAQLPSPSSPPRHWAPRGLPSSALSPHAEPQCTEGPHPWGSLQGKAVWFIQGHREGTWHRPGTSVSPSTAQARLHAPPGDKTHWGSGLLKVTMGSAPGFLGCPGQSVGRERPAYCHPACYPPIICG